MSELRNTLKNRIQKAVSLAPYTTFHLGGDAELFLETHTEEELAEAVRMARDEGWSYFLLGGGSNLVVSDKGVSGLVIRNHAENSDFVDVSHGLITLSSGWPLAYAVGLAWKHSLSGFETFTGIPGTVGGAIYGNAGAYGRCVGDLLVSADILTPEGEIKTVGSDFFQFAYRTSLLKSVQHIVLKATFRVSPGDPAVIRARIKDIAAQRHSKHPPKEVGSAGSFFKNLDQKPGETQRRAAGEFLEKAGAKEIVVGGASVYAKHANFIVNYGEASASDVRSLASILKQKVFELFGIELHEEVIYVGR
ncbi:MAG: UDP-N-acetylmuramate dehydrogenase [Candidatus Riflebacteria bacterium]|nr:UDP-N-acetylmuramate dehydrogenase [Candidatus Riflebacteria bacterium]